MIKVEEVKKILIVDDSEIDREVLKRILCDDYDVIEVDNGYSALEILQKGIESLDAIMLDVSMPVLDGFSVLRLMQENKMESIPVFLITAEATKDNVTKAIQFKVAEFIKKPFDRADILKRLNAKIGSSWQHYVTEKDINEMKQFVGRLKRIYEKYLTSYGKDISHYEHMTGLMKLFLNRYSDVSGTELSRGQIELISNAAFFCDIGYMLLPYGLEYEPRNGADDEQNQSHTRLGADIIKLNSAKKCQYFVQICADMCLHHHETWDGNGFPDQIYGSSYSVYTQMCRLADRFDCSFFRYLEHNEMQFDFVVSELAPDWGGVSPEIFSLLTECKSNIILYYGTKA